MLICVTYLSKILALSLLFFIVLSFNVYVSAIQSSFNYVVN